LASAGWLIWGAPWISRADDDNASARVYRGPVPHRAAALRRWPPDPLKLDRVGAVLLTATFQLEVWVTGGVTHDQIAIALSGVLLTSAVAIRRAHPTLVGVGAGFVAAIVAGLWGPPSLLSWGVAWMCCLYALAVWAPPRRFALGMVAITIATIVSAVGPVTLASTLQFCLFSTVAILLVHRVVGDREQRVQIAERERDLAAREAVVDERARIARELHDVIAHNVSMIVVQAGAERRVLNGAGGSTREVLETIERIGRGALTDMRRLLGMLRSDAAESLAPQPRLGDLPRLVETVCEAGLPVELWVDGERRELPAGIELSAYRIVQEALTNALKHAGDARARVSVRYGADSLELEIADDGAGGGAAGGAGHGLVGMRERVALYGGHLDAQRGRGGGFVVRVKLPVA
jgi:signal transduction histidine kinase